MTMKKVYKKGSCVGYAIGKDILIHGNFIDTKSWFITIKPLEIYGERLCEVDCNEQEIARYINLRLRKSLSIVNGLIDEIIPFT